MASLLFSIILLATFVSLVLSITQGQRTSIQKMPFMAVVIGYKIFPDSSDWYSGGIILDQRIVLSNFQNAYWPRKTDIAVGVSDLFPRSKVNPRYSVKRNVTDPKKYFILYQIYDTFWFSDKVQRATLPVQSNALLKAGTRLIAAGYGSESFYKYNDDTFRDGTALYSRDVYVTYEWEEKFSWKHVDLFGVLGRQNQGLPLPYLDMGGAVWDPITNIVLGVLRTSYMFKKRTGLCVNLANHRDWIQEQRIKFNEIR